MASPREALTLLREAMRKQGLEAYLQPVNDEFMGEYLPESARRLEWLTGFSGSAGVCVVTRNKAALFVDGRYTAQAAMQVDGALFEIFNSADTKPEAWLAAQLANGEAAGYDARLHTRREAEKWEAAQKNGGPAYCAVLENLVDAVWKDRPAPPASPVRAHPEALAGESSVSKRLRLAAELKAKRLDAAVITDPASICWLLNVRGDDVPFTPFALSYALLRADGSVEWFISSAKVGAEVAAHIGAEVRVSSPEALPAALKSLSGRSVLLDTNASPAWFWDELTKAGANIQSGQDPCLLPKACKNAVELEGTRRAHLYDGLAVTRFMAWLKSRIAAGEAITEIEASDRLEAFRREQPGYVGPSFSPISGFGAHGAVVHYRAEEATQATLRAPGVYLIDSGGQYCFMSKAGEAIVGTTDITRTLALGEPTPEQKEAYTRVLKGHIALVCAVFPEGTTGSQLDALARQYLWEGRQDYDHGTGHGVGSYLSVHEGPQRIGKRGGDAPLLPGMILSNEPGYYQEKGAAFGIRIESLVAVVERGADAGGKRYFGFETLTRAPIDESLVAWELMTPKETEWLRAYNRGCAEEARGAGR